MIQVDNTYLIKAEGGFRLIYKTFDGKYFISPVSKLEPIEVEKAMKLITGK